MVCCGKQHTGLCGFGSILFALFHVHIHLAYSGALPDVMLDRQGYISPDDATRTAVFTADEPGAVLFHTFSRYLYRQYTTDSDNMTRDELAEFLLSLHLGDMCEHDDHHDHDSSDHDHQHNHYHHHHSRKKRQTGALVHLLSDNVEGEIALRRRRRSEDESNSSQSVHLTAHNLTVNFSALNVSLVSCIVGFC